MKSIYRHLVRTTGLFVLLCLAVACTKDPAENPQPTPNPDSSYADGEARTAQEATSGLSPVNLIILGDGFMAADYQKDGAFDQAAARAIGALFSIEPYKTFRSYFKVQKVAAYSAERGGTFKDGSVKANTVFKVILTGGNDTGISGDNDKVFTYAKKAAGITDAVLKKSAVLVISNVAHYSGTTYSWNDGRSIAYVALSTGSTQLTKFENVAIHEWGGHGFGRLDDEYYSQTSGNIRDNAAAVNDLQEWQMDGYNLNVSLSSDRMKCPWDYIFKSYATTYPKVSLVEGGALYRYGVWRPEPYSCMDDNRLYFNTPSRVVIVKRIMEVVGAPFTMEEFIARDVDRNNPAGSTKVDTKALGGESFVRLAPPVRIRE